LLWALVPLAGIGLWPLGYLPAILLGSAVLMSFMPKYRHGAGHVAEPAAGTPLAQQV
jgi:hypothetical protein